MASHLDALPGSSLIDDDDDTNVKRQQQRVSAMETYKDDRLAQLAKLTDWANSFGCCLTFLF